MQDEVKKFGKLLESQKFRASGEPGVLLKGKGKKTFGPLDLQQPLMDLGINGANAYQMGEWVIDWFHKQREELKERNQSRHQSHYVSLLLSENGALVRNNNSDAHFLVNLTNWHSTPFKLKSLEMELEAGGVEDVREAIIANFKSALFEYQPYKFEKLYFDGNDHVFNEYQPPMHFFNIENNEGEWPAIQEFFNHFFTDKEDYNYYLDWMATSLIRKNNIFLLFPAAKGIGKNFLAERLLLPLYGESNFSYNRNEDIKSKFNSNMVSKQLSVVDEFTLLGQKDNDAIKNLTNRVVAVEEKFKAKQTKEISCNIVLFTNRTNRLKMDDDQRRFSILPTTSVKLDLNEELMLKYKTVDKLGEAMEAELPAFYKFLRERVVLRNMNLPRVNEDLLEQITFESAASWENIALDCMESLKSGRELEVGTIQADIKEELNQHIKVSTIANYLKTRPDLCEIPKAIRRKTDKVVKV